MFIGSTNSRSMIGSFGFPRVERHSGGTESAPIVGLSDRESESARSEAGVAGQGLAGLHGNGERPDASHRPSAQSAERRHPRATVHRDGAHRGLPVYRHRHGRRGESAPSQREETERPRFRPLAYRAGARRYKIRIRRQWSCSAVLLVGIAGCSLPPSPANSAY